MSIKSANRNEVRKMKIIIEATPEEIAKLLQAIGSSKEQSVVIDAEKMVKNLRQKLEGNLTNAKL